METFGTTKSKILKQLTEAYIARDKNKISSIIKLIKENKEFLEVFKLYDIVEEKYFEDSDVARLFVEEISKLLNNKNKSIQKTCNKFDSLLTESINENNRLYDALDHLLGTDDIRNIDKKIIAKKEVIKFLTTKKPDEIEKKVEKFTMNETLLSTVLINNFNSKFDDILDEEEKRELKDLMILSNEEIKEKIDECKMEIENRIKVLKEENSTSDVISKLDSVLDRVNEMDYNRLSYYKISKLQKDL